MKTWIIAALVVGMLVFATLGVVNFVKAESQSTKTTQAPAASPSCSGCGASCNHASTGGSCGCGASCGCTGSGGCGCKATK